MKRRRVFYGWWILAAGMGVSWMYGTLILYGFSAFFIPWRVTFGWSRALLGGVSGLARLEGGLVAPVAGWFIDKYGPRRTQFWSLVLLGILSLAFAGCNAKSLTPALVLEKAYAATTEELTSFRFTMSVVVTQAGLEAKDVFAAEGVYLAPDRMWMTPTYGSEIEEQVVIGNKMYLRRSESSRWSIHEFADGGLFPQIGLGSLTDPLKNLDFMTSPDANVTQLDNEAIDGVDCQRYQADIDPLEQLLRALERESDPAMKKMRELTVDLWRDMEATQEWEVWIGAKDYLVRQVRFVMAQKAPEQLDNAFGSITIPKEARYTITSTMKLSGFNESVEINAPTGPFR